MGELFSLKQNKNEDPIEFLNQIKELVTSSDWYGISENEAICLFFTNCTNCGRKGHLDYNCGEQGHSPGSCQLSPEKIKAKAKKRRRRKKWAENRKLRLKMLKNQSQQNLLDVESSGQYWAESLSDGETVIDTNHEEDSLEEITDDHPHSLLL